MGGGQGNDQTQTLFIEPDEAISAFKKALKLNPTDALLASKLGRAYVKTHQYVKAINYYNEAVVNADHSSLKLDLSELYLKLKQYTNAEQTLVSDIETLTRFVDRYEFLHLISIDVFI